MANFTSHYGLKKPEGPDYYSITDANLNSELLDGILYGLATTQVQIQQAQGALGSLNTTEKATLVGAINELLVQIGGVVTQISGMVSTLNATNLEVTEAMEGFDGLDHRLDLMDSATATVAGEVIAARDGESSLSERLAKIDVDLETALSEDGQPKLYEDLSLYVGYSTPLTGVFNTTLSSTTVTGTDTVFLTELSAMSIIGTPCGRTRVVLPCFWVTML